MRFDSEGKATSTIVSLAEECDVRLASKPLLATGVFALVKILEAALLETLTSMPDNKEWCLCNVCVLFVIKQLDAGLDIASCTLKSMAKRNAKNASHCGGHRRYLHHLIKTDSIPIDARGGQWHPGNSLLIRVNSSLQLLTFYHTGFLIWKDKQHVASPAPPPPQPSSLGDRMRAMEAHVIHLGPDPHPFYLRKKEDAYGLNPLTEDDVEHITSSCEEDGHWRGVDIG